MSFFWSSTKSNKVNEFYHVPTGEWWYLKYPVHICSSPLTCLTFVVCKSFFYDIVVCKPFPWWSRAFFFFFFFFADACWCAIVLVMSYNLWLMWQRCWYRMLLLQLRIMIIELDVECILSLLFLRSTRNIIVNHCTWLSWESTCHTCCFCCFTGQVEAADLLSKYRLLAINIWGCYCQSRHHFF